MRLLYMRYLNLIVPVLLCVLLHHPAWGNTPAELSRLAFFRGSNDLSFKVGIKGGINFTAVIPLDRFSVLQPIQTIDETSDEKDYAAFYRNLGYQYGFIGMVQIGKALSISLEPTFSNYTLKYEAASTWTDASNPSNRIVINTNYADKLRYFEIPLVLRYQLGSQQIRPYLAAGFSYGMLTGASGNVESSTVQYINNIEIPVENSSYEGDIANNFINTRLVTFPGAGIMTEFSFATLFIEADYYFTLHNVTDESSRYSNQQAVGGYYNVPDNLKPDNLVINLGILFNINRASLKGGQGKGKGSAVECPAIIKKR